MGELSCRNSHRDALAFHRVITSADTNNEAGLDYSWSLLISMWWSLRLSRKEFEWFSIARDSMQMV